MLRRTLSALFVFACALPLLAYVPAAESVYTDIAPAHCKTVETREEGAGSVQKCAGVGGYTLLVEDNDSRQSVTVVGPDGKEHPLNYSQVITTGFSSLGEKAEWRVEKKGGKVHPYALIVRVNASENPEKPEQKSSYLAVAKITDAAVCVTDKVKTNEEARQAADASADKPCRESE
ncbi:MAG: hypothetical protein JOZ96_19230 [Acidobacteria bacterium]|nr:hypothetical protein [Acidobacteriota bacterium]MBV9927158.1 hypothetical protein [Acidobacteriota bacterium]